MKTVEALYKRHNSKHLNVEDDDVCKRYFGLAPHVARRYARENKLGVRAFQVRQSNGAPWFVDIEDLAKILDSKGR
jgi:hypothetical protein